MVIDIHYYPGINMGADGNEGNPESFDTNVSRFYALWEQIAQHYNQHYKGYLPTVYFEILNEPNKELGAARWNDLVAKALKIIRKTNPDRTVVVGTPNLGQSWTVGQLDLPPGEWNVIVDIHCYTPATFTHQGASWVLGTMAWKGTKWTGTREKKAAIKNDLGFAAAWGKRNHCPIYLGEFGTINVADLAARVCYTGFMRLTAEKHGMSLAIWNDSRGGFDVFNEKTGRWIEPLRQALSPTKQSRKF